MSWGWDAERRAREARNKEQARAFYAEIRLGNARRLLDWWGNHRVATEQEMNKEKKDERKEEDNDDNEEMGDQGQGQNHGYVEAAEAKAEEDEKMFLTKDYGTQHDMT